MTNNKKTKKKARYPPCRKVLHCETRGVLMTIILATVYKSQTAFGTECVKTGATATGPRTWRARYMKHDDHDDDEETSGTLFRCRFLSAGTLSFLSSIAAVAACVPAMFADDYVYSASATTLYLGYLGARMAVRGLWSPSAPNNHGPIMQEAVSLWNMIYPGQTFFSLDMVVQVMTGLTQCGNHFHGAFSQRPPRRRRVTG